MEVAAVSGVCEVVVNNRLKRFEAEGIKGLDTRAGRGRPPILSPQKAEHLQKVEDEIKGSVSKSMPTMIMLVNV